MGMRSDMTGAPRRPGRMSRILDICSLALVLTGAVIYGRTWFGLEEIRTRQHAGFVRGETEMYAAVNEHARLSRWGTVGIVVAGLGIVVGASAAAHSKFRDR